jgi:hypothetical protein
MKYKIKTNMEVIKEVYAITKNAGMSVLFNEDNYGLSVDFKKAIASIFEGNLTNRFCQVVTGEHDINFDQLPFAEQEEVILSFFTDISRLCQESLILQIMLQQISKIETHSLTSALSSDSMGSTPTS